MSDAARPAMFYAQTEKGGVRCALCPHNCNIPENKAGICGVRKNMGEALWAAGYGRFSALALDPIEKKPLYRFHPGKRILSVGGFGCNLRCPFCQNCDISIGYENALRGAEYGSPEQIAALARETVSDGNIGVAYTYNEPLIGIEFVYDCARLVREAGLYNILVTNGYVKREPLETLLPWIDAMNIDLKGFTDNFYKKLRGSLEPVRETIEASHKRCHMEITTLIIPGENDSAEEIESLARWIASLNPEIPLHLTRFFPRYQYSDKPATPQETVYRLSEIARKHLTNVFLGNIMPL